MTEEKTCSKKVIIFDVWGDYAHFKQNFATTSAITFSFPPRNTIIGLIGAILGLKRKKFPDILSPDNCDISLSIRSDVSKKTIKINLISTKHLINERFLNYFTQHTQIPFQFLINPSYRIYFSSKINELYDQLKKMI
ncbi:MAG: CRISPR-associated protein Cas5, partial [Candidatus Heimdallarchaeaceae archaeon]